jgi:hypothetical protein
LRDAPQGHLNVPAFEEGAAVQIQREAGGDVEGLEHQHRRGIGEHVLHFEERRAVLTGAEKRVPEAALSGVGLRREKEGREQAERGPQHQNLEAEGDEREPDRVAADAATEHAAPLARGAPGLAFELAHRQRERAQQVEPHRADEKGAEDAGGEPVFRRGE